MCGLIAAAVFVAVLLRVPVRGAIFGSGASLPIVAAISWLLLISLFSWARPASWAGIVSKVLLTIPTLILTAGLIAQWISPGGDFGWSGLALIVASFWSLFILPVAAVASVISAHQGSSFRNLAVEVGLFFVLSAALVGPWPFWGRLF